MAFIRAPYTSLAAYGGPGLTPTTFAEAGSASDTVSVSVTDTSALTSLVALTASDTVSVSVSESVTLANFDQQIYRTQFGVIGGPVPFTALADKTIVTTFGLNVSDTLSVQWLEQPVDDNQIVTGDTLRITLSEVSSLLNYIQAGDTVSVQLSETISLLQSGVTLKTASDTLSVTLTEASTLGVTVAVTDTASVSVTDTSSLATPSVSVVVTDTVSVSLTEDAPLLGVFTGVLDIVASDVLLIGLADSAIQVEFVPPPVTTPFRIRITPRLARIRIVPQ